MEKLSKNDINRVKDTLKVFISKTAGCEDNEDLHKHALSIFGKEFNDKPSLVKQAASAYNSNKSIFKLSDESTARGDFGLLDPQKLYEDLSKQVHVHNIEKAAGAEFSVRFYKDKPAIDKVASAPESPVVEQPEVMHGLELDNYMSAVLDDRERLLIKSATRRDICAREAADCYDTFCLRMNNLSKEARAQVAKNIISAYPVDGKKLIDRYRDDNKLVKMASFKPSVGVKSCPKGDIYTQAQDYMVAEFAKNQADELFKEAAANTLESYKHIPGLYKMYKNAAGGSIAKAFTGSILASPVADTVFPAGKTSEDIYKDIMSTKLVNQLREVEVKNLLIDMYSEPFIASYPADEIELATSQALQMLPTEQRKHPRRHASLIKTWVADILGRGGNMSAADTDKILTASSSLQPRFQNDPTNRIKDLY